MNPFLYSTLFHRSSQGWRCGAGGIRCWDHWSHTIGTLRRRCGRRWGSSGCSCTLRLLKSVETKKNHQHSPLAAMKSYEINQAIDIQPSARDQPDPSRSDSLRYWAPIGSSGEASSLQHPWCQSPAARQSSPCLVATHSLIFNGPKSRSI